MTPTPGKQAGAQTGETPRPDEGQAPGGPEAREPARPETESGRQESDRQTRPPTPSSDGTMHRSTHERPPQSSISVQKLSGTDVSQGGSPEQEKKSLENFLERLRKLGETEDGRELIQVALNPPGKSRQGYDPRILGDAEKKSVPGIVDTRYEEVGVVGGNQELVEMEAEVRKAVERMGWRTDPSNAQFYSQDLVVRFTQSNGVVMPRFERWGKNIDGYLKSEGQGVSEAGVYTRVFVPVIDIEAAASHAHGEAIKEREVKKGIEEVVKQAMEVLKFGWKPKVGESTLRVIGDGGGGEAAGPAQGGGWMRCPACEGSGYDGPPIPPEGTSIAAVACTVCEGKKIIGRETGRPPR